MAYATVHGQKEAKAVLIVADKAELEVQLYIGQDGTPVLHVDTPELEEDQDGPILRIRLNEEPVYANPVFPSGDVVE